MDFLPRIPAIRWLSAGQLDGMTDMVLKVIVWFTNLLKTHRVYKKVIILSFFQHWMEHANLKELIAIDLDASDNLTEELLGKFINNYGPQLKGRTFFGIFIAELRGKLFFPLKAFACPA